MKAIIKNAKAKVNLFLHVNDKRADGYHFLESLVAFAEVKDILEFYPQKNIELDIKGKFAKNLLQEEAAAQNIVIRAAELIQNKYAKDKGAKIVLTKNIPVGAGLGGGSSDAAATIEGLCELWELDLSNDEKQDLGIKLGADVPVCLLGKPAFVSGIGEKLLEIKTLPEFNIVLVNPNIYLSTKRVFERGFLNFSEEINTNFSETEDYDDYIEILSSTRNDLEENAKELVPEINDILNVLASSEGALIARMSGSGATCFAIFKTKSQAENCAKKIRAENPQWWVENTVIENSL